MSNTKNIRIAKLRKRLFKKNIKRSKVMNIVVCIIFALYTLTLLYPLFWALLASLKTNEEFMLANRNGFPIDWTFANYVTAYESMSVTGVSMIAMLFNSFWYSGVGAFLNVFVCATSAYVLSRYKFIGQKFIYGLAMLVMVLPIVGALPSEYRVYHILGIADSPLILLTQVGGFGFNFIVLYGIFKGIAKDYMEAAFVDGAGHFTVFFRIMLPQVTGTMLALFLVMFIGRWNDYNTPLLYMRDMPTLSTGLFIYKSIMDRQMQMPVYFAGIFICCIPPVILYAFFQKSIMDVSIGGGIKG